MSGTTREQVMGALLTQLSANVVGVKTFTRKIVLPSEIGPVLLPSLSLYRLREKWVSTPNALPNVRHWDVWLILVVKNLNRATVAGDTIINPILDSIEDALSPSGPGRALMGTQTLGGLVQQVIIEGDIHVEPGDTDPNGIGGAVIPLHIVVP